MPALKYSRQRECIRNYLVSTKEHPTADTVYINVKKEFPNISLGTVYRNLNLLAANGEIIKISTPQGGDRFDGRLEPHTHFFCTKCGQIFDMEMKNFPEIIRSASEGFAGTIDHYEIAFYGECKDCKDIFRRK